jgi:hypothetical protein
LIAHDLRQRLLEKSSLSIKISYVGLLIFSILIACALFILPHQLAVPDPKHAAIYLSFSAIIIAIGISMAVFYAFKQQLQTAIIITITTTGIFLIGIHGALQYIDTRTIAPLASILKPILKPQDEVVAYNQYYQDLPFYLERRVSILNWKNEMRFGMAHQDTQEWMIQDTQFWQRWHSNQRVFAIMGQDSFEAFQKYHGDEAHYVLGETLTNVLIANQPIKLDAR